MCVETYLTEIEMDLHDSQKEYVLRMLNLQHDVKATVPQAVWKVLIFDRSCLDILAPLVNKGEMLQAGITLRMNVHDKRERIEDVPAIYFLQPTEENIELVVKDLSAGLYDSYFFNFSSALPSKLLERLAHETLRLDCAAQINKIYDQHLDFVSLERNLISLNHHNSFTTLHSAGDQEMLAYIERIVGQLFSVFATMGKIPLIYASSKDQASMMVAQALADKIRGHHAQSHAKGDLFSALPGASSAGSSRPILVLVDRALDLSMQLAHPWTYQALVQDLLGLENNQVELKLEDGKTKSYTLDSGDGPAADEFWRQNAGLPFPTVLVNFQELNSRVQREASTVLSLSGPAAEHADMNKAIGGLTDVRRRKDSAEMHLHLSTAIVKALKERKVDEYFSLERDILASTNVDAKTFRDHIGGAGSVADKIRLLCIRYLASELSKDEVGQLIEHLASSIKSSEKDVTAAAEKAQAAVAFFKHLKLLHRMASSSDRSAQSESRAEPNVGSGGLFATLTQSVLVRSEGLLAGVRNLLPTSSDSKLTQIVDSLMNKRDSKLTADFKCLDPRARRGMTQSTVVMTGPAHQQALVLVLGAGSYNEYQNLQDWVARQAGSDGLRSTAAAKHVIYGATEILSPESFLQQVVELGKKK